MLHKQVFGPGTFCECFFIRGQIVSSRHSLLLDSSGSKEWRGLLFPSSVLQSIHRDGNPGAANTASEITMKNLIAAAVLAMPFALNLAFAQAAQQGRMADCNKEAKD